MPAHKRSPGFTLLELVVVLGITLVITAMALPRVMTAVADMRLRSAANGFAGILTRARMTAVKNNRVCDVWGAAQSGTTILFLECDDDQIMEAGEPRYPLPGTVGIAVGVTPVPDATLGFTPQGAGTVPRFSPRGLPCVINVGACVTRVGNGQPIGFANYLQDTRSLGPNGLAAVTVNPSGHTRVFVWNGTAWRE
jgi:prepilin-type N-terminal cleavage/methylation domain-containing protein